MKPSRALPALLAAVLAASCAPAGPDVHVPEPARRAPEALRVLVAEGRATVVHRVALEDYVQATILSEFAPTSGEVADVERMFEVQSVIGRTYAVAHLGRHAREGYDVCATTHCQLFDPSRRRTSRWAAAAASAATRTAGTVLWYGEAPANTLFHADCGGYTSDAATVWGGMAVPYLRAMEDGGDASAAHAAWQYEATADAVQRALSGDRRTNAGARLGAIAVVERDLAGRATRIRIEGSDIRDVRAEVFREVLSRAFGPRAIRSTRLTIARRGQGFAFTGRGFGHGVGLCQAGALARIRRGATLQAVLHRYYPGTTLVRMTSGP
jgi:stage II sporulation protein D